MRILSILSSFAITSAFAPSKKGFHSSLILMARKAGVSSPEELKAFVASAGSKLLVGE
jgi:hypothetical protein